MSKTFASDMKFVKACVDHLRKNNCVRFRVSRDGYNVVLQGLSSAGEELLSHQLHRTRHVVKRMQPYDSDGCRIGRASDQQFHYSKVLSFVLAEEEEAKYNDL